MNLETKELIVDNFAGGGYCSRESPRIVRQEINADERDQRA